MTNTRHKMCGLAALALCVVAPCVVFAAPAVAGLSGQEVVDPVPAVSSSESGVVDAVPVAEPVVTPPAAVEPDVVVVPAEGAVSENAQTNPAPTGQPDGNAAPATERALDPGYSAHPDARQVEPVEQEENLVHREAKKIKSFEGAHLMVGRNVKVPTQTRKFAVGIDLAVAPLNIVANRTRDAIVDEAVNQICSASPDQAACTTQVEGAVDQVLETLEDVTPEQWEMIRSAAGGDPAALDDVLEEIGISDPAARTQVVDFVGDYAGMAGSPEQRMQAVDAVRTVSSSGAISLMFEPYLYMNFKWIEIVLTTPFALQIMDGGGTEIEMANIGLNFKSGGDWSVGKIVSFGFAGGIELHLPSGTPGISKSINSDIFSAPKFSYGYVTWAPYLVVGMDLARVFQLQTHLELVSMHDVLETSSPDHIMYLKYGAGFIVMPKFVVSLLFEMNGCRGLINSTRYDTFMVATGINIRVAFFKMYLGVQIPLLDQGRFVWDSGYWTSANYILKNKFTVMSRIGFEF